MTEDQHKLLALIESWESGYISPSAQIVFRDARLMILDMAETIEKLNEELDALRSGDGTVVRSDVDIGGEPEPKPKSPRKLRSPQSSE
jgi:hypothetical protein